MKKFSQFLILSLCLLLLNNCAKPTVVKVTLANDKELSCKKLKLAIDDALEFRRRAINVTGNTAQNQVRAMLFWPALATTYINAHNAIVASSERTIHLVNIMHYKDCKNLDKVIGQFQSTFRVQTLKDLSEAYKNLNELYKSGGLSEKEYKSHKHKVLGQ